MPQIQIKIVSDLIGTLVPMPKYATEGAAGLDLCACLYEPITIKPNETVLINSGIAIHLANTDRVGLLFPRSGLATKHGINLANGVGVIDSDYTGEIRIALHNHSEQSFTVNQGDRIAQLVIMPINQVKLQTVTEFTTETARGSNGFGSTGLNQDYALKTPSGLRIEGYV